ncbi:MULTISPECIES: hypothetical protein [Acinetobacter]|nr:MULTISPECIES: hypothetical protein [Acinetobacter]MDQ9823509.1 hypothetical protein [Acinetobacter sp. 163]EXR60851.1 hypothetical protein J678_3101 [Acinetobacter sp. 1424608]MCE7533097.1 hypothetical protein [Acinetobacter nosocomialis]MCF1271982.1 hypothetical protein [Acinetobacter nosocomialis]MCF1294919.1 hypothetical protein [Acinetobacter nosocomialis]
MQILKFLQSFNTVGSYLTLASILLANMQNYEGKSFFN